MKNNLSNSDWQTQEQRFFERLDPTLKRVGLKPVYSLLISSKAKRAEQKELFFKALEAGYDYAPDLTPEFDQSQVGQNEADLLDFRNAVKQYDPVSEAEGVVKDAYRWKVNEVVANLRIALAAKEVDAQRFAAYNRFIYGAPSPELFASELERFRSQAQNLLSHAPEKTDIAHRVLDSLPQLDAAAQPQFDVQPQVFDRVKAAHQPYFDKALAGIDVPAQVNPMTGKKIITAVLKNLELDRPPQNIKQIYVDIDSASYNRSSREVRQPRNATYSAERFVGLYVGHEIGRHALEAVNAESTGFNLLIYGLDRSEMAGEGKGVLSEQIVYKSMKSFLEQQRALVVSLRHFSAGLAVGLDGQPRNFGEVFRIIEPIFAMYGARDSKTSAWDLLANRILKGAPSAGTAYLKDMIYAEGNKAYWELAASNPESIPYWDIGKADLTNLRHISILQKLGILPTFKPVK